MKLNTFTVLCFILTLPLASCNGDTKHEHDSDNRISQDIVPAGSIVMEHLDVADLPVAAKPFLYVDSSDSELKASFAAIHGENTKYVYTVKSIGHVALIQLYEDEAPGTVEGVSYVFNLVMDEGINTILIEATNTAGESKQNVVAVKDADDQDPEFVKNILLVDKTTGDSVVVDGAYQLADDKPLCFKPENDWDPIELLLFEDADGDFGDPKSYTVIDDGVTYEVQGCNWSSVTNSPKTFKYHGSLPFHDSGVRAHLVWLLYPEGDSSISFGRFYRSSEK